MAVTEIRKSILIIKSQTKSLSGVENFLRNREWQIHSTTGLKDAITYIVSQRPTFVLVNSDHPNKKVRMLPKLLAQNFPVMVMVYADSNTSTGYKSLIDSGCAYRINPPLTGPAVERMINKMMKEKEEAEERARNPVVAPHEGESSDVAGKLGSVTIGKGGGAEVVDGAKLQQSAAELLRQMESVPDDDSSVGYMPSHEDATASSRGPAYVPSASAEGSVEGSIGQAATGGQFGGAIEGGGLTGGTLGGPIGSGLRGPGIEVSGHAEPDDENAGGSAGPFGKVRSGVRTGSAESLTGDSATGVLHPENDDQGKWVPNGEPTEKNAVHFGHDSSHRRTNPHDSIMVRGTQTALDESVTIGDGKVEEKLENSSNVACLIIESPRFSGYLVAALGKNRKLDENFIKIISDRLMKFLRDSGEQVQDEGTMGLKIKPVDFEGWALEYAEFLRKSVHNGEEIAMAFFPFQGAKSDVGESANAEMGAVKIEDLKGDIEVEFNLYIYLPTNKKYVLYTPKGGTFYGNQKGRLEGMGVTHLHVQRAELQDLSKYRAQNYLNEKIDTYEETAAAASKKKSG